MGLTDRVYNIAKGYLDKASQRWEQLDSNAQKELDQYTDNSNTSAWDRAQAKIAALDAQRELKSTAETPPAAPVAPIQPKVSSVAGQQPTGSQSQSTIAAAYQILGIPAGSNIEAVRDAYQKLTARAAPDRFPAGSKEQAEAQRIERRACAAYMMLADALSPADDRFDRLEI